MPETEVVRGPNMTGRYAGRYVEIATYTTTYKRKRYEVKPGEVCRVQRISYSGTDDVPYRGRIGRAVKVVEENALGAPETGLERLSRAMGPRRYMRIIGLVPGRPRDLVDIPLYELALDTVENYARQQARDQEHHGERRQCRSRKSRT